MPTRPILAAKVHDIHTLRYPLICTPKIDGIRCRIGEGPLTRSNKEIPNIHVRTILSDLAPTGLDGELLTYTFDEPDDFHTVQSKLMSEDGEPDFRFLVFDYCPPGWDFLPYFQRLGLLDEVLQKHPTLNWLKRVPSVGIYTAVELEAYETECLNAGFEGVCMRSPTAIYKSGRSTLKEQHLLKLKRFTENEAIIVGYTELQRNANPAEQSELGYLKRSKRMDGMRPGGILGTLQLRSPLSGVEFGVGTGFTLAQRQELWERKDSLIGLQCTYKSQPYGALEAPRCPVFRGIRYDLA